MTENEYLKKIVEFIESPAIKLIICISEDFGKLLTKIAEKQGWGTTELLPENEKEFEEIFKIKKSYVILLYKEFNDEIEKSCFSKDDLEFYFDFKEYLGPQACCIKQLFAIIRNKEESFKEKQSLLQRKDDLFGIKNQIEAIKQIIEIKNKTRIAS